MWEKHTHRYMNVTHTHTHNGDKRSRDGKRGGCLVSSTKIYCSFALGWIPPVVSQKSSQSNQYQRALLLLSLLFRTSFASEGKEKKKKVNSPHWSNLLCRFEPIYQFKRKKNSRKGGEKKKKDIKKRKRKMNDSDIHSNNNNRLKKNLGRRRRKK